MVAQLLERAPGPPPHSTSRAVAAEGSRETSEARKIEEKRSRATAAPVIDTNATDTNDLPDLSCDTTSASIALRPSFEQLNATLFSRGYLRTPLNVAGLVPESVEALADALHAIIAQREEDLEVRGVLTAKTRTLTASLERTKRFLKEESDKCVESERKAEAAKVRLHGAHEALQAEQLAHKSTKEALNRTRRELQLVKAAALQHRALSDRNVARVRARIGEVTASALRASVADFRVVSNAFEDVSSRPRGKASTLAEEQIEELERKRADLLDMNQALKRLATEAINAVRRADAELLEVVEAEEEESHKRSTAFGHGGGSSSSALASSISSSSGSSIGNLAGSKRGGPAAEAWLQGHRALFQRDLFPASQPFTTAAAAQPVSGPSTSKAATSPEHPAVRALSSSTQHFAAHVQALLDLRTSRLVHEAESLKRSAVDAKEAAWHAKLISDVKSEIENDSQFSVNRPIGLAGAGGGASAASGRRQAWTEEKKELERKLVDTVKRLAVAEQNVARREKELKKVEESERRARRMVDEQASREGSRGAEATARGDAKDRASAALAPSDECSATARLHREREEAKAEKQRYARLSDKLEREREEVTRYKEKLRAEEAERRALSAAVEGLTNGGDPLPEREAASSRSRKTVTRLDPSEIRSKASSTQLCLPPVIEGLELSSSLDDEGEGGKVEQANQEIDVEVETVAPTVTHGPAPSSNAELEAIFGRGFSDNGDAVIPMQVETEPSSRQRRKSDRLPSSSVASTSPPLVAAEAETAATAAASTTRKRKEDEADEPARPERRKSRRISDRERLASEDDVVPAASAATTSSPAVERKRRRLDPSSEAATRDDTDGEQKAAVPSIPREAAPPAPAPARPSRRLSTRERVERDQAPRRDRRPSPATSSSSPAAATSSSRATVAAPVTAERRLPSTAGTGAVRRSRAVPSSSIQEGGDRKPPASTSSSSRLLAPTASSLNRASSSAAERREKRRDVLANATNRTERARGEPGKATGRAGARAVRVGMGTAAAAAAAQEAHR